LPASALVFAYRCRICVTLATTKHYALASRTILPTFNDVGGYAIRNLRTVSKSTLQLSLRITAYTIPTRWLCGLFISINAFLRRLCRRTYAPRDLKCRRTRRGAIIVSRHMFLGAGSEKVVMAVGERRGASIAIYSSRHGRQQTACCLALDLALYHFFLVAYVDVCAAFCAGYLSPCCCHDICVYCVLTRSHL